MQIRSKLQIGYEMEKVELERVVGVWGGREISALKSALVEEEGWTGDGKRSRQQWWGEKVENTEPVLVTRRILCCRRGT